ncbi:MAG: translation elongation factor EF-1 subunit alpha [Promethearchaeota archaeon]
MPPKEKPHLNLVIIGHIDHGKSTLMGHVLVLTGAVTEKEARDLEKIAKELDRESWKFAYFMDKLDEERKRGITIDLAFRKFETQSKYFTIIDAPGHQDFVKNMITGASQADAAILVVSGKTSEFAPGISEQGQTREHAFLAKTLGVNQLIVVINKADDESFNYSEERFNECKAELEKLLTVVGYNVKQVPFIPVSALKGDNLVERSSKMPWYKGPTLIEALDALTVPEKPVGKPLRLPIQDVFKIKGVGVVPVGRVETGKLKVGDKVIIMPNGFQGEVRSIEMHHEAINEAIPGDNIGFNIRGATMKDLRRGYVVSHPDNPCNVVVPGKTLTSQIIVIWHPTAIAEGYTPVVHAHTSQLACKFVELTKKLDPRTGQVVEEKPQYLKKNDAAIVKLSPIKKMCIEKYKDFPEIGRLAVRDMGRTVAVGVVLDLEK